jgi:hypothetical protein
MTKILIDGVERQSDHATSAPWATLLESVDRDLETQGRIVVAVTIDGVDVPAFRDATMGNQLVAATVVALRSGTENDLMTQCVQEAADGVETLRVAAAAVGAAFRRHDLAVAHDGLRQVAGGLSTLIAVLQAVALAGRVNIQNGTGQPVVLLNELSTNVQAVIAAQGNQDWLTVADVLEYDIEPALKRWQSLFAAIETADAVEPLRAAS